MGRHAVSVRREEEVTRFKLFIIQGMLIIKLKYDNLNITNELIGVGKL